MNGIFKYEWKHFLFSEAQVLTKGPTDLRLLPQPAGPILHLLCKLIKEKLAEH